MHRAIVEDAEGGHIDALLVQGLFLVKDDPDCVAFCPSAVTIGVLQDTNLDVAGERCVAVEHDAHAALPVGKVQPNAVQLGSTIARRSGRQGVLSSCSRRTRGETCSSSWWPTATGWTCR